MSDPKPKMAVYTEQPMTSGYHRKMAAHVARMAALPPGAYVADIYHDEWCACAKGTGPCNCDPHITVRRADLDNLPQLDARGFVIEKDDRK
jgi:hypothetical protein